MKEPIGHLAEFNHGPWFDARLVSSTRLTPEASPEEVRELVLDVERRDFPYQLGQSVGVRVPGSARFGRPYHFRLYSVADLPEHGPAGEARIKICVRRCFYVDEYSGERYPGVASNYLCDLRPSGTVTMNGPYGLAFNVPEEHDASLILIGSGTGIAPFRAFVKHLHRNVPEFTGKVWLFYGAQTGLELFYMNDVVDDFAQYYDRPTFEAFKALSPRPHWSDPIAWNEAIGQHAQRLWEMLADPVTHVYVAGLEQLRGQLDRAFAGVAGSPEKWARRKAELMAGGRWVELLY